MPDVASHIECTRTVSTVVAISTNTMWCVSDWCDINRNDDGQVAECILLEGSDSLAEQTGADDQDEIGHYDEENRKCCGIMWSVLPHIRTSYYLPARLANA